MSIQRRLLLYLLLSAPIVWGTAMYVSVLHARNEVNEMLDTELVRLAQQLQAMALRNPSLGSSQDDAALIPRTESASIVNQQGDADIRFLAVALWDPEGRLVWSDREGSALPYLPNSSGLSQQQVLGTTWRIYYQPSTDGKWLVAAGQSTLERDELVYGLTLTQAVPWLFMLPVLLALMAWAVRRALAPMRELTTELEVREARDLRPIPEDHTPQELRPLLGAINGLFLRLDQLLQRERRFTADAAHELRTPLAVLRAQWDVVRRAGTQDERRVAEDKLNSGLERMERLVTQLLALSRAESGLQPDLAAEIDWAAIVEQAMSDCLALSARRNIELACEWPEQGTHPMPLLGNPHLLTVLLRNLIDNATRYAPEGSCVTLRFTREYLEVDNEGPSLSPQLLSRLGERFYRPDGQRDGGSGLGVSIVQRIAALHGLRLEVGSCDDGNGVRARLQFCAQHQAL